MPRGVKGSGTPRPMSRTKLRARADELRAELARIEAQTHAHDAERHRIIGRVVDARADADPAYMTELNALLAAAALSDDEKRLLGLKPAYKPRAKKPRRSGNEDAADMHEPSEQI